MVGWNWAAFLGGFVWFFYRKLYLWGAGLVVLPVVLTYLMGGVGSTSMGVVLGMFANSYYVQIGLRRVAKADALGLTGAERDDYLARAGGTSKLAGGIALAFYLLFLTAALLSIVAASNTAVE